MEIGHASYLIIEIRRCKVNKTKNTQQIPFRLHVNDHKELKSKLALQGMKIQTFVEACVQAYLDGDDHIADVVRSFKKLNTVDKKNYTLSKREQEKMLEEIERQGKNDDG